MKWALVNSDSIIKNVITYDGVSEYTPPDDLNLMQVPDWLNMEDHINKPEPTLSIEQAKGFAAQKILLKRDLIINSGITVLGKKYKTDNESLNMMLQSISIQSFGISSIFPLNWILYDDSVISVSFDDMKNVAAQISGMKQACYSRYVELLNEINLSNDPLSVNIDLGWPQN